MSAATNFLELKILDDLVGNTPYTPPATIYVALATNATTPDVEAGTFTECTGSAYVRQGITGTDWATAASGAVSTSTNIEFPTAQGDWGVITHVALMDNSSGGNALVIQQLASPKTVETGDTFVINSGNLTLSLD